MSRKVFISFGVLVAVLAVLIPWWAFQADGDEVAGADVPGAEDAGVGLAAVGTDSDTLINFLRRGRPYLVKLRR